MTGKIAQQFELATMTINFNSSSTFREARGKYAHDDYTTRVQRLTLFMKKMAKSPHNVSIFNLQEITSRYMPIMEIQCRLLDSLHDVNESWTCTPQVSSHGNIHKCLSLMTFWRTDIYHLNGLQNCHFDEGINREMANALLIEFSLMVPDKLDMFHSGGELIDNDAKYLNVNVHMPQLGANKLACWKKLLTEIDHRKGYFVSVSGNMNLFLHEIEFTEIVQIMKQVGNSSVFKDEYLLCLDYVRKRNTTFLGMLYDLQKTLKLDLNHDNFLTWMNGQEADINRVFNLKVCPLDWHLSRDQPWLDVSGTRVIDMNDLRQMGFDVPEFDTEKPLPDWGNYITDHLPLLTQLMFHV